MALSTSHEMWIDGHGAYMRQKDAPPVSCARRRAVWSPIRVTFLPPLLLAVTPKVKEPETQELVGL
jgi:hypothetical protein